MGPAHADSSQARDSESGPQDPWESCLNLLCYPHLPQMMTFWFLLALSSKQRRAGPACPRPRELGHLPECLFISPTAEGSWPEGKEMGLKENADLGG